MVLTVAAIENEETKGVPIETLVKAAKAVGLDLSLYVGEVGKDWLPVDLNV